MWRVINLLTVRRLVTVSGAPGVGKSAILAGSCQYLAARDVFKGGIIFVRLGHRAVTQSRFLELIEDALVQQSKAVEAAHRLEEEKEGFSRSADLSLNPPGSSAAASGGGNLASSPLPPLPHPRVPRASDVAALQQHRESQADQSALLGTGLLGDFNRRSAREAWIIRAFRDRTALLVVDHADALLRRNNGSVVQGSQGSTEGNATSGGTDSLEGKPLSLRLSHDTSKSLGGAADDDGNSSDDDISDNLDSEEEGGGLRGFLGRLFHGARHMKVLLATNASSEGSAAISSGSTGGHSSGLSGGRRGGGGDHLVSAMVPLGPLSLQDAVRLFCRLSPRLRTAKERKQCLEFLAPTSKVHQTGSSSLAGATASSNAQQQQSQGHATAAQARESALLAALGNGFPGHIVQLALAEASLDQLVSVAKAYPLHVPPAPATLPSSQPPQSQGPVPPVSISEPNIQPQSDAAPAPPQGSSGSGSIGSSGSALPPVSSNATVVPPSPTAAPVSPGPNQQLEGQPLVRMQSQLMADAEATGVADRGGGVDVPH